MTTDPTITLSLTPHQAAKLYVALGREGRVRRGPDGRPDADLEGLRQTLEAYLGGLAAPAAEVPAPAGWALDLREKSCAEAGGQP